MRPTSHWPYEILTLTSPGPNETLMLTSPGPNEILTLTSPGPNETLMLTSPGLHVVIAWQPIRSARTLPYWLAGWLACLFTDWLTDSLTH